MTPLRFVRCVLTHLLRCLRLAMHSIKGRACDHHRGALRQPAGPWSASGPRCCGAPRQGPATGDCLPMRAAVLAPDSAEVDLGDALRTLRILVPLLCASGQLRLRSLSRSCSYLRTVQKAPASVYLLCHIADQDYIQVKGSDRHLAGTIDLPPDHVEEAP